MSTFDLGFTFDVNEVDDSASQSFDRSPIPPGPYLAHITTSEVKDTKAGTGKYIALTWEILEGQHAGRRVFQNVNIINPNPTAESIGRGVLKAICAAAGVERATRSDLLHNIPMNVKVKVTQAGPDKQGVHRDSRNEMDERGFTSARRPARTPAAPAFRPAAAPQRPAVPGLPPRPAAPIAGRPTPPWMKQGAAPAPEPQYEEQIQDGEVPF